MIKEDYVSFETAKLLKEKGFDQECDYATSWYARQYYKNSCQGEWFEGEHQIIEDIDDKCNISYLSDKNIFIPAPTLQMAMKWLRTKNIFIDIFHYNSKRAPFVWMIFAYNVLTPQRAETYEEAEEAAIKYALENWDDVNKVLDEYYKYDNLLPKI